jgi:uncharacterized membrane protein
MQMDLPSTGRAKRHHCTVGMEAAGKALAAHRGREASSNQRAWDAASLAFGTLVILLGWSLVRKAERRYTRP